MDSMRPGHYTSQFLTEHGNFKAKFHSLGLAEEESRSCAAVPQTARHVLIDCPRFENDRAELVECVTAIGLSWPPALSRLVEEDVYPALELCAIRILNTMGYRRV